MPDVFISQPNKSKANTPPTSLLPSIPKTEGQKHLVPGHSHNRLSAFSLYPDGVDFETREKEEKVILLLRAHPITNFKWILITTLMIFAPVVIGMFGFLAALPAGFGLVIMLSWYLVTLAYTLQSFLSWYFNVYFVTDKRVVDVDFYNLIDKKVSDADLSKIQDVSYTNFGIFRMIFNYGDVFVQTAAEVSEFDFLAVPDPDRVVKIINELKENDKNHDNSI